jgi:radical SAM protein with 4Fe4S-binding SPASM domain
MKVALIQCPGWGRDCPPYTMALLAAILRNANHKVYCFDLNNALYCSGPEEYRKFWDDKDLYTFWSSKDLIVRFIQDNQKMIELQVEHILNTEARVIGFTVHFSSLLVSLEVAKRIKEKDKKRIIVFGGPDCCRQLRGLELIREDVVDIVNVGEGDISIIELVRILEKEGRVDFVRGALIKNGRGFADCGDIDVVDNLDTLPFPDYSDFTEDILSGLYRQPERLEILDSRGCITRCHFCSEWQFWKRFRSMSGERIFAEISFQIKKYPQVDYFYFIGSLLNGNIKALSDFCDLVIKSGLKIRWLGQPIIRKEMTREFLQKMKKAGCQWLGYGIESGSQRVVNKMNKKFSLKLAEQVLRDTHDVGIQVQANFMFGIPTETEEDFKQTLNFLKRNRDSIDSVLASQSFCVIDKDTYLYNHPEQFGIIDREHHLYWEAEGGNTYPERFRRYEEFCKLALSLGIPETSGVLRVKPDKWRLLGDYYLYKKDYSRAIDCFQKVLETESQEDSILDKINLCQKELENTNIEHIEIRDSRILQDNKPLRDFNYEFNPTQKKIIEALSRLDLKQKIENFILIEKQKLNREEYVQGYPYWLTIDPTNFCTLKCPFCPTGQGRNSRAKTMFSLDNFKKIIDELGPYLIHIDFCNWGEPLLNSQIYEMIKIAKQYHIDTKIDSNLNQFSEEDAERMIAVGLDKIIVSIDGITPETYSKYRVGGDFNKVMNNLKLLLKKKRQLNRSNPYISWQFLVFRHNEHEIEEIKRMGNDLGVDHVGITKAFIGNKDWIPLNEEYSNYRREGAEFISPEDRTDEFLKAPQEKVCNWPWEAMVINPNGSVSVCCSVEDEKDDFGNIFQQSFMEVWNNEKYRAARKYIKDKKIIQGRDDNICINCRQLGMINLDILSCHSLF